MGERDREREGGRDSDIKKEKKRERDGKQQLEKKMETYHVCAYFENKKKNCGTYVLI